jgi:hypothetical protein
VKKVIELLEKALDDLESVYVDYGFDQTPKIDCRHEIEQAIAILQALPRWETPQQWEKRTGNKYPENAAVRVFYSPKHGWDLMEYWRAKQLVQDLWRLDNDYDVDLELIPIVCDCGVDGPPPDDWRPEET